MASGDVLDRLYPPGDPPSSNYATFDTRNQHTVLDFDASVGESAIWASVLPANYSGGGLTVTLVWSATSATSGDVAWQASIERIDAEGLDTDADSFSSSQSTTATAPATSGMVKYTDITFTAGAQMDGLLAGELFRLRVTRDATVGGDTMTGDAEIHAVVIRET